MIKPHASPKPVVFIGFHLNDFFMCVHSPFKNIPLISGQLLCRDGQKLEFQGIKMCHSLAEHDFLTRVTQNLTYIGDKRTFKRQHS